MNDVLRYKGYRGVVGFSMEDAVFHGEILGINDVITFESDQASELYNAFVQSVDDYLLTCAKVGKKPEKEYSGTFNIRLNGIAHKLLALKAEEQGVTLNKLVGTVLERFLENG